MHGPNASKSTHRWAPGLCGVLALGLLAMPSALAAKAPSIEPTLTQQAETRLKDRTENDKLFRKVIGRIDDKQYFITVRGNLFAFQPGGPAVPLASVYGLWTSRMIDDPSVGGYLIRNAYCGTFVPFGTETIVARFPNPVNDTTIVAPHSQRSGANIVQGRRPSGIWYRNRETGNVWDKHLYPFERTGGPVYPWQIVGDQIFMRENLVDFRSDKPRYEDMTFAADLGQLMDDNLEFVPSTRIYNTTHRSTDYPWFDFGDKAANTFLMVHATGRKLASHEGIPESLMAYVKEHCPTHLDGRVFDIDLDRLLVR